ncbi:MAG: YetF domain-containing protein, partial [Bacillus sp. (in: firmicutes)]
AIMEETGDLSVIPMSAYRPVQPNDLNLNVKREYLPIPLIMDGQILNYNLRYLKLDQDWLMNEVEKMGETIKKITLATLLDNGKLFIDNNEMTNHQNDPYYYNPGKRH